jgi:nitrite reductase (NADH) small subunit
VSWIKITQIGNIPLREGRAVKVGRREIAIFHLPERYLAIDNMCPHNQGPLCDGIVKGTTVVCPLHGWNVCLESGRVVKPDLPVGVNSYQVRVTEGIIEVDMPAPASEEAAA